MVIFLAVASAIFAGIGYQPDLTSTGMSDLQLSRGGAEPIIKFNKIWRNWDTIGAGYSGLSCADFDGDGIDEIVSGATSTPNIPASKYWQVSKLGPLNEFYQFRASDYYPNGISTVTTCDINGDGAQEICVGTSNKIEFWSHDSTSPIRVLNTSSAIIRDLYIGDVDADGEREVVFHSGSNGVVYVINFASGLLERSTSFGGEAFSASYGNLDSDPQLELVFGTASTPSRVFDALTLAIDWTNPFAWGTQVHIVDIDGASPSEVLSANDHDLYAIKMGAASKSWQITSSVLILGITSADFDSDGLLDIAYGESFGDQYKVVNAANGTPKYSVPLLTTYRGFFDTAVGNVDADPGMEFVAASRQHHTYVINSADSAIQWDSKYSLNGTSGLAVGDIDADGSDEVVVAPIVTTQNIASLAVYDARTQSLTRRIVLPQAVDKVRRLAIANVDADIQEEIFIVSSDSFSSGGQLMCIDGVSGVLQYSTSGEEFSDLALSDIDLDGTIEAVVYRNTSLIPIKVYDANTGALKWSSPLNSTFGQAVGMISVANVDLDPMPEIVFSEYQGRLVVVDVATRTYQLISADLNSRSFDCFDFNRDGKESIVTCDTNGLIAERNEMGATIRSIGNTGPNSRSIRTGSLISAKEGDVVVCANGAITMFHISERGAITRMNGPYCTPDAGVEDALFLEDITGDSLPEIFVLGDYGLSGYRAFSIR